MITNYLYLRNPVFDSFFIGFIPLVAISSAWFVYLKPEFFNLVLFLDLTLLGYHHVISTYTRLGFDKKSLIENRVIVFYLPPIIMALVAILVVYDTGWIVSTIYLHWQWYHYSRQSEGIAKSIKFKSKSVEAGSETFNRIVFYLIPIACFMAMSSRQPQKFLYMDVYTVPIPVFIANILLGLAAVVFCVWLVRQLQAVGSGQLKRGHLAYLLSHHIIYLVAYVVISEVSIGWLAINIWHNMQYISFVWHFNTNKFKAGFDKRQPVISWISQSNRAFIYVGFCLILTSLFYSIVDFGLGILEPYTAIPLVVVAYQTINFHHYIVDSVIWKLRKPAVHKTLELQT